MRDRFYRDSLLSLLGDRPEVCRLESAINHDFMYETDIVFLFRKIGTHLFRVTMMKHKVTISHRIKLCVVDITIFSAISPLW